MEQAPCEGGPDVAAGNRPRGHSRPGVECLEEHAGSVAECGGTRNPRNESSPSLSAAPVGSLEPISQKVPSRPVFFKKLGQAVEGTADPASWAVCF